MNKRIKFFTLLLLCSSLIITISSCNKDEDTPDPVIPEVTDLALKNAPTEMNYYEGDILDLTGLIITLTMDNGESEDIAFENLESNGITCSPSNGTEITEQTDVIITHTVSGKSINLTTNYMIVTDADGNVYQVVKIGEQFWMTENLKTTKYNDGTAISLVTDYSAWSALTTEAYSWYSNDVATNKDTYGALYNWYSVHSGNLCPSGWHVPTDAEWTTLTDYVGGLSSAADKLKESGTTHWVSSNSGITNEIGFTALPGGYHDDDGSYDFIGGTGAWWSATEDEDHTTSAWSRYMNASSSNVDRYYRNKGYGFSVRCVRD